MIGHHPAVVCYSAIVVPNLYGIWLALAQVRPGRTVLWLALKYLWVVHPTL